MHSNPNGHLRTTVVEVEVCSGGPSNWPTTSKTQHQLKPGHSYPPTIQGDEDTEESNLLPKTSLTPSAKKQIQIVTKGGGVPEVPKVTTMPHHPPLRNTNNNRGEEDENDVEKNHPLNSPSSPNQHFVFSGVSRLSPPPLSPGHSYSAPPSPSAGSKGSHLTHLSTLTSIDIKLRKWMNSKYGRIRKRVVFKNGEVNLSQNNVSKRKRRYLADIFTTLVDIQWRFTLLIFTLSFLLSWLFFAGIWWTIGYLHGDLDPENLQRMSLDPPEFKPCFQNFHGFTSAFLFSIETQHTIGYGSRFTTEECPFAIFTMCMQSILGVMIQAVMVGVMFAKMARPKKRTQTLMFSRQAVVCQRDGQLCLMFRVGDMRKSHIISANVRAQLIRKRVTKEGEILPYYQHELKVGVDSDMATIFFIWPVMVVHRIDKESPLYGINAADLIKERFEIVVILEGVIETTGSTTQARSSYLPSEILWGHRFEPMVSFRKEIGEYAVDHTLFNHTYEVDTPLCSARDLDELNSLQQEMKKQGNNKLLTPFRIPAIAQYSLP